MGAEVRQHPPATQESASLKLLAPAYLTAGDVAELLRVSEKTVYRWATEDPTFPVFKRGRGRRATVRFPREALERWIAKHEQGTSSRVRALRKVADQQEPASA